MKYVQISTHADGWGKTILFEKHRALQSAGVESYVFWARGAHEQDAYMRKVASFPESCLDALATRLDGRAGFHSKRQTRRLLKALDKIDPDIVHLHTLTGYYINIELLFEWLASHRCKVVWTMHDCWAFTGHCIHFTQAGCDRWLHGCPGGPRCPELSSYPPTLNAATVGWNYEAKKRLFTSLPEERLSIVTPSNWLAEMVSRSFFSKYGVSVVHNTVNEALFKPTPGVFREKYGLAGKHVVLGISTSWSSKKGLDDFLRLAADLGDGYAIVLIGLSKKQVRKISALCKRRSALPAPARVIPLEKTDSVADLVDAYSSSDVFFNPTKEDTYPTVNLEAESCATPVVTYDVGGCAETVRLPESRCVDGYESAVREIVRICTQAC